MYQKSRIQWLKLGDGNNKFFFRAVKERYIRNSIHMLYDSEGNQLTTPDDIQAEINHFYTQLLGNSATDLLGVDLKTMRSGSQLHSKSA